MQGSITFFNENNIPKLGSSQLSPNNSDLLVFVAWLEFDLHDPQQGLKDKRKEIIKNAIQKAKFDMSFTEDSKVTSYFSSGFFCSK